MKRVIAVAFVATFVLVALGGVAGAKSSAATAQAAGDQFVNSLMPSSDGQPGVCEVKTDSGFFANRTNYLASCGTNDGTFEAVFVTDATGGGLKVDKSPFLKAQTNKFCGDGHAYSVAVKQKFGAVYFGTGDGTTGSAAAVAKDMRDLLASSIPKSTRGYVKPFTAC